MYQKFSVKKKKRQKMYLFSAERFKIYISLSPTKFPPPNRRNSSCRFFFKIPISKFLNSLNFYSNQNDS